MIIGELAGSPAALAVFNLGHVTNEFATGLIRQMFETSPAGDALLVLGQFLCGRQLVQPALFASQRRERHLKDAVRK